MTPRHLMFFALFFLDACGECTVDPPTLVCLHDACVCPPGWYCDLDQGASDVEPTPPYSVECAVDSFCEGACDPECSTVKCDARAICWVELDRGDTASCASGSQCDITCSTSCAVYCAPDAECLLTCPGQLPTQVVGAGGCE